jgi:hypothetical protein
VFSVMCVFVSRCQRRADTAGGTINVLGDRGEVCDVSVGCSPRQI